MNKLILVLLFIGNALYANSSIFFRNRGENVATLKQEQLLQKVKSQKITIFEPHEEKKVQYRVISMRKLLDDVYGESWKKAEEILFTCSDGYQPTIPVSKFKKYDAYLAYGRVDSKFEVFYKLKNTTVALGPYYLVWDNQKNKDLRKTGDVGFPFQIVGMDLVRIADRFPKLAPPAKHSKSVARGFIAFRKYCMTCHTINGSGGKIGPELNEPVSVTLYFKERWLKRWIDNPLSIRKGSKMPGIPEGIPNRKQTIEDIIEYLKAMRRPQKG